jgi:enamine deaminase RidA (YjgF/YER057c/UK114 family)
VALELGDSGQLVSDVGAAGELTLLTWAAGDRSRPVGAQAEHAYLALDATLRRAGAVVLQERVFGNLAIASQVMQARSQTIGPGGDTWAVQPTFIEGAPIGGDLAGVHVMAARARQGRLVTEGSLVLGRVIETEHARLIGLGDVSRQGTSRGASSPAEDARAAIDAAERVLAREGFSFRDVVRTWYYLRDILAWYGPFNLARNAAFRRMGLIDPGGDGAVPASTGIGGRGLGGGWCMLDLVAAQATAGGDLELTRLHNRKQNEATQYGSAFARGTALTLGGHRYLFVSGTASIDHRGATVHLGDFDAQTRQTIENIDALLEGAGATLGDVRQATVFLRDPADLERFAHIARQSGLDRVPPVIVAADACREDLLVEIDATAVVARGDPEARR